MTSAPGGNMVRLRGARVFSHSKVSPPHAHDDSFSCVGLQIPLLCCCVFDEREAACSGAGGMLQRYTRAVGAESSH
jgi:hypothetical protein